MKLDRNIYNLNYANITGQFFHDVDRDDLFHDWITYTNYDFRDCKLQHLCKQQNGKVLHVHADYEWERVTWLRDWIKGDK